jgi:hypothetical protein
LTLLVDNLALVVGHVVIFEQILANIEVVGLDLALGILDRPRSPRRCSIASPSLHAQLLHDHRDPIRGENTHQVVFAERG